MNRHPFKTGKLPAKHDKRTLRLADFLKVPAKLPAEYSIDKAYPGCRPHMYLNDTYGDCVMACQAELQDRMVLEATGKPAHITDAEVKRQYFKETGNVDSGLVLLDALKTWRKTGWTAGGVVRKLGGFLSVDHLNTTAIKTGLYLAAGQTNAGLMGGVALPEDAMDAFMHGKPWTSTKYPADPAEGHCVYLGGWGKHGTTLGVTLITWAGYQFASFDWWFKYGDELYLPFNELKKSRGFDVSGIGCELAKVA